MLPAPVSVVRASEVDVVSNSIIENLLSGLDAPLAGIELVGVVALALVVVMMAVALGASVCCLASRRTFPVGDRARPSSAVVYN